LQKFVASTIFDLLSTGVVLVNVVVMFVALEMEGYNAAVNLGLRKGGAWVGALDVFDVTEHMFSAWFTLELLLRYWVFGRKMFDSAAAVLDALMVAVTLADLYVLQALVREKAGANLSFGRMVRLIKLVKLLRTFHAVTIFRELRVLIQTIASSFLALMWSMVLLTMILVSCGMFMAQLMEGFIKDPSGDYDLRLWAYRYYGSGAKSVYTMFEATMSGCWPTYARRMIEEVSPWYALFWVVFVVIVVFAVIRVMGALFLSATLRAAGEDEDMAMMRRLKEKEKYRDRLYAFFAEADANNDGKLMKEELCQMLRDPKAAVCLHALELEIFEVVALFDILDDGGGNGVTFEELLNGAFRVKGPARAIDINLLMHQHHKLKVHLYELQNSVDKLGLQAHAPATEAPATEAASA